MTVIKHHSNCQIPDMTKAETAFQRCPLEEEYDTHVYVNEPVYIGHKDPSLLVRIIQGQLHAANKQMGHHPTSVLVDLPCTLFMLDVRNLPLTEDVARLITWSPQMMSLAEKARSLLGE